MRLQRTLTLALGAMIAAASIVAIAAPAQARGRTTEIAYIGTTGTWAAAEPGVSFSALVRGEPFNGRLTGYLEPVGGVMPPWPGCVPGQGTMAVSSRSHTVRLTLRGDLCRSVSPAGYLIFKGWHDVVDYGPAKSSTTQSAAGRGSFELLVLTDGSLTYAVDGEVTSSRR